MYIFNLGFSYISNNIKILLFSALNSLIKFLYKHLVVFYVLETLKFTFNKGDTPH